MALSGDARAVASSPRSRLADAWPAIAAAAAALVCAAPAIAVLAGGLTARIDDPGAADLMARSVRGTMVLVLVAGAAATALGAAAAWLVTLCQFPGRRLFEWLLVLPLAAPVYVLAYAYGAITGPGGPAPIRLSGLAGAGVVYALGFYPYVYLAARAAFVSQSVCALEAARALGATPWRTFLTVALPLAWPGIAAGAALACMEIAADYGAAAYFGAETVTTGVFRAWFARGEPQLALQLAAYLLAGALALLALERYARGRRSFAGASARWRPLPRYRLAPAAAGAATLFCATLVVLGAAAPLAWLLRLASFRPLADLADLGPPLLRTLLLAGAGAALTLTLSALIAASARRPAGRAGALAAAVGYAAPGAVTALGAMAVFAAAREAGLVGGLGGALSIAALLWVYAARFAAAGAQPIEAGLTRVGRHMGEAGRTLGASPSRRLAHIDLPIAAPGVIAGALVVFVDILKELPATLVLRPFDFETLAVRAHSYASDDRLTQAAAPALLITLAGLAPVIMLSRRLSRARAGDAPGDGQ
ncbi:MAG: iron ABC transporter permease [Hyphomonadaceae bacterium]|nr:iron ABC transporter permease [Hyphomonadaceae bacterium]